MMDKQYYPYDSYGYIITPTAKGGAVGVIIWSYECSCTTIHFFIMVQSHTVVVRTSWEALNFLSSVKLSIAGNMYSALFL